MEKWVRHDDGAVRVWALEGDLQSLELARQGLADGLQGLEEVPSAATARVQRGVWGEQKVYLKEYFNRDAFEPVKDLFRPSRAHRALRGAAVCEEAGFTAPKPVCLIETGPRLLPARSLLVTEAFPDAPSLRDWLEGRADTLSVRDRWALLRAIGRLVGHWHAGGMFHGDLHPGNLLCRREGEGMAFCWLDIERTRRFARLPLRYRVKDLVTLNYERLPVSLSDRMRVWEAYVEGAAWPGDKERALLDQVLAKTQARWRETGWM